MLRKILKETKIHILKMKLMNMQIQLKKAFTNTQTILAFY